MSYYEQQVTNTYILSGKVELLSRKLLSAICLILSDLTVLGMTFGLLALSTDFSLSFRDEAGPSLLFLCLGLIAACYFYSIGHYQKRIPFWDETREVLKTSIFLALAQGTLIALVTPSENAQFAIAAWPLAATGIVAGRTITKIALMKANVWQLPTVIIGDGPNATDTAKALLDEPLLGYYIVTFLSVDEKYNRTLELNGKTYTVRCLGSQPEKFLRRLGSPHVIVALEKGGLNEIQSYFDRLTFWYPKISVVPALKGLPLFGAETNQFFSHEVLILNFKNSLGTMASRVTKRTFDIVGASALIVLLSPLFLWLAYKVRKTGKQIIFGHQRVGQRGKQFRCYKFRSMVENSQEVLEHLLATCPESKAEWDRDFKLKNDPRITSFGRMIRKTSLDELPQLFNVLIGNMSLVGPRPVIEEEVLRYGEKAVFYEKAKPGITGLWQVSGRNDIDYESRVDLDVWYVRNWSLWNDVVILIRTISVVLKRDGAY